MSLAWAKTAAVLSVVYAGINVYQMLADYDAVREKARMFAEIAAEEGAAARLRIVRGLFYVAAPLAYLWTLLSAGLPVPFLVLAGAKFWVSAFLGVRAEARLLRGHDYEPGDHRSARLDAIANIGLAGLAVWLILQAWT